MYGSIWLWQINNNRKNNNNNTRRPNEVEQAERVSLHISVWSQPAHFSSSCHCYFISSKTHNIIWKIKKTIRRDRNTFNWLLEKIICFYQFYFRIEAFYFLFWTELIFHTISLRFSLYFIRYKKMRNKWFCGFPHYCDNNSSYITLRILYSNNFPSTSLVSLHHNDQCIYETFKNVNKIHLDKKTGPFYEFWFWKHWYFVKDLYILFLCKKIWSNTTYSLWSFWKNASNENDSYK